MQKDARRDSFFFTNLKTGQRLDQVIRFIETEGFWRGWSNRLCVLGSAIAQRNQASVQILNNLLNLEHNMSKFCASACFLSTLGLRSHDRNTACLGELKWV